MEGCPDVGCGWWTAVTAFMAVLASTLALILNIYFKMEDWRKAEERIRQDGLDAERELDLQRQVVDLKAALERAGAEIKCYERLCDTLVQQSAAFRQEANALGDRVTVLEKYQCKCGLDEDQKSE
ncbi:hypothetical protein FALBO_3010 [Fusarium albosuccineum]|uniref:Uncharacterized protein n=1 Tax=Fusarium albosuccineum TaxID=1237068 RepID=A0A8H4LLL6_9HYPO|nr:hypothetical protein FALBO_3010 [Fusarium albosuccineum]